jgi:hypothetical protein
VFDEHYREKFRAAGLLNNCGGELQHLISDAATMQIIRWTGGGFGMAAHNYDGDMLTDEIAQVSFGSWRLCMSSLRVFISIYLYIICDFIAGMYMTLCIRCVHDILHQLCA